jgi:nitrogen fixation protein FixH
MAARFRRWLALEAVIGIGVVALTGVLVDTAPPVGERAAATARAFTAERALGSNYRLSVAVYPLVPGMVHVAVQLTNRATVPVDAFQVTAQLELPARQIGPLAVPLTHQFTGSWVADNVEVPLGGHWQLLVAVLTDPITEVDTTFHFTIYG